MGYAVSSAVAKPVGVSPQGRCWCDSEIPGQVAQMLRNAPWFEAKAVHFGLWDPYAHAWWAEKISSLVE